MSYFQTWASGLLNYEEIQEMIHQREYHTSLVLQPEELKARWEAFNYQPPKPKPIQLKMKL